LRASLKLQRNSDALFFTAWLHSRDGRFSHAIALLEEARGLSDSPSRVFDLLASAYLSEGNKQAAIETVSDGLTKFPDDSSLKAKQVELERGSFLIFASWFPGFGDDDLSPMPA
jgi:hypothetical protein